MHELKVFNVTYNTDYEEGRGQNRVLARFATKEEALKLVKHPYFRKYSPYRDMTDKTAESFIQVDTIKVFGSVEEAIDSMSNQLRSKALEKLTKEERLALGV